MTNLLESILVITIVILSLAVIFWPIKSEENLDEIDFPNNMYDMLSITVSHIENGKFPNFHPHLWDRCVFGCMLQLFYNIDTKEVICLPPTDFREYLEDNSISIGGLFKVINIKDFKRALSIYKDELSALEPGNFFVNTDSKLVFEPPQK